MSLKSKLQRMKGHLQIDSKENASNSQASKTSPEDPSVMEPDKPEAEDLTAKWEQLGFQPFIYEDEVSYQKRTLYPYEKEFEGLSKEIKSVHQWWKEIDFEHPLSSKDVPLNRLMFFDTETTGLSTGAGNSIFLIGYSRVLEEGIEVVQHVLGDPSSEAAFMYGFLKDFHMDDYLVSYNGKSFDWPQVKSRHAFVRDRVPKLPAFGHIDLLHAARRLWKHELPSCRLSVVEQEKLFIQRENDTPGSMAPLLYFEYLHDKNPQHLSGIIEHNAQDVRSLITLYVVMSKHLNFQSEEVSAIEHVQIGRWFEQTGSVSFAMQHYEKALTRSGAGRDQAHYRLGLLMKKQGETDRAKQYFLRSVAISSLPVVDSWIELAKIAEHHDKNFTDAFKYSRQALEQLKRSTRLTGSKKKQIAEVEKRMSRLEGKLI